MLEFVSHEADPQDIISFYMRVGCRFVLYVATLAASPVCSDPSFPTCWLSRVSDRVFTTCHVSGEPLPGYRSKGLGSIPGAPTFPEK
jgi:hypothetical protein